MKRNLISFFMGMAFMVMFAIIGCTAAKPGSTTPTFNASNAFNNLALAAQAVASTPLPPGVGGTTATAIQDWAKYVAALAPQAAAVAQAVTAAQASPATAAAVVVPTPAVTPAQ